MARFLGNLNLVNGSGVGAASQVLSVTPTHVLWITAGGFRIEGGGTGLSATTGPGGALVLGGVFNSLTFSLASDPAAKPILTVLDTSLPFATAAGGFTLSSLAGGADIFIGGADDELITAGGGDDTVVGEGGADRADGGAGFDFVSYASAKHSVTVNLGDAALNGGEAKGDTFISIEGVFGSAFGDSLIGDNNGNVLFGGGGDDVIFGLGAGDVLDGDEGHDVVVGGLGDDTIRGGLGDDTLVGEDGADKMDGGEGFDFVSYASAKDFVTVNLGDAAFNGGEAKGDTYASIEGVFGSASGDSLIGDHNGNVLFGSGGDDFIFGLGGGDVIDGEAGHDQVNGGRGDDTVTGGEGDDVVEGEDGADSIFGWNGNDTLLGGEGDDLAVGDGGHDLIFGQNGYDTLLGLDGDDVIGGNYGADLLFGGSGADRFIFFSADDSRAGAADRIVDLFVGDNKYTGDVIDLSAIDANVTQNGDQAFSFRGFQGAPGPAGSLQVGVIEGVGVFLFGYVDHDADADLIIDVGLAGFQLGGGNFLL
jgi:Ca2+-binding RTX toxin-like protein